ncbi:ASCH domain-containing protein [Cellulophaga fucicola]|uniref:Uncharacterized protein YhfF n=1 Tax=Cellulophaga fucicola TaxID=76595 RepID=A0A1K1LV05_9FLAO|nr:ASCH domain-containing protein [Cellulophaga fucicola]SFW14708.1 Uncharacterized protein YhfF [Cellulophaga fucicola]
MIQKTMKPFIFILLLTLICCKNESKIEIETESESIVDESVSKIWNNYIKSNPDFKDEKIPEADFFHNNEEDANRLAKLTVNGKKKTSSSLYSLYKQYNVDLPKIGAKQIITNFDGKAKAIIKNKSVDTIPFNKISKEYAELDIGTNIEPLKKWKKAHWKFFKNLLKESGEKPTEEMLIVCVSFETIWTEKH